MSAQRQRAADPGGLSIRMQALEPTRVDDGLGGASITFAIKRSLWAAFEPDPPQVHTSQPTRNTLAIGMVRTALGVAPPAGWRLSWQALGGPRTVEVEAVQAGTPVDPFDLCRVREVRQAVTS